MAERVCPVWVGYLLANPLRKLSQSPDKILRPYIKEGMTALDTGCAMGFFSLPLARMVGAKGRVICVDLQEKMIRALKKRARKAGLDSRIETRVCGPDSLGLHELEEKIDFALAFAVVHEVPDPSRFFSEIFESLRPDGKFLICEPKGHITMENFEKSAKLAESAGFSIIERPRVAGSRSMLLGKGTG